MVSSVTKNDSEHPLCTLRRRLILVKLNESTGRSPHSLRFSSLIENIRQESSDVYIRIQCVVDSENVRLEIRTMICDIYEPPVCRNDIDSGYLRECNGIGFIFIDPPVKIEKVEVSQENQLVRGYELGKSPVFGDVGFEYLGRHPKWRKTSHSSLSNMVMLGIRSFAASTFNYYFSEPEPNFLMPYCEPRESNTDVISFPLDQLSPELLFRICGFFPKTSKTKVLLALSGVNRRLRNLLSHPSYWDEIDISMKELKLPEQLTFFEARCRQLKCLKMTHCQSLRSLAMISCPFSSLSSLDVSCSSLVDDNFVEQISLFRLQRLSLAYCNSITQRGFRFLMKLDRLESLNVGATRIDADSLISVLKSSKETLKELSIHSLQECSEKFDDVLMYSPANLETVDLSCSDRLTRTGLHNIFHCCGPTLQKINLRRCGNRNVFLACDLTGFVRNDLALLSCKPRGLKSIGLPIFVNKDDLATIIAEFGNHLEQLFIHEVVDFNSAEDIRQTLQSLVLSCRNLRVVTIRRQSGHMLSAVNEEFCEQLRSLALSNHQQQHFVLTPLQW